MTQTEIGVSPKVLGLKVGDLVEVRTAEEILATLDERGELENLPFMPEMLASATGSSPQEGRARAWQNWRSIWQRVRMLNPHDSGAPSVDLLIDA